MFLMKIDRNEICEPDSNRLFWKKAKNLLGGKLQELMAEYSILNPKGSEFKAYQTINYCERILAETNAEEVENYSTALSKVYKWLNQAI